MDKGFVIIKQETLQKLLNNFYEACSITDEMDVYDESIQEMKEWTDKTFGRTIDKDNYE